MKEKKITTVCIKERGESLKFRVLKNFELPKKNYRVKWDELKY